jgi:ABC-type multidrug transport system permease subunit
MKSSTGFFIGIVTFTLIVFGFMLFVQYMDLIKFAWWWFFIVLSLPSVSMFIWLFVQYIIFKKEKKNKS